MGLFVFAVVTLSVCGPKCAIVDSVSILDHRDHVFLVSRIAGIQEKVVSFELYGQEPSFDECRKPKTEPYVREVYDDSEGLLRGVEVRGRALRILYTSDPAEAVQPDR
jgi:hypothetical protein